MQEPESYGKVKLSTVKAAIKQIEEHYQDCPERLEEVEITFEYLVGSFFPKIVENIQKEMKRQYTLGYLQRVNEEKENTEE
jgi:chromosome segregation and condensation protein ScpB